MKSALLSFRIYILLVYVLISGVSLFSQRTNFSEQSQALKKYRANAADYTDKLQHQPLLFIENRGQVADAAGKPRPDILFTTKVAVQNFILRPMPSTISLPKQNFQMKDQILYNRMNFIKITKWMCWEKGYNKALTGLLQHYRGQTHILL